MSDPEKPEAKSEEETAEDKSEELSEEQLEKVSGGYYLPKKNIGNITYNDFKLPLSPTKE